MKTAILSAFALALNIVAMTAAEAGIGPWQDFDGGRARLIAGETGTHEQTRAWIEIELEEGWKTYWIEPGDGGVPPSVSLTLANRTIEPEITMPAPRRFREPNTVWAGYTGKTYMALDFSAPSPSVSTALKADVFLGVCETICIPVKLALDAPLTPGDSTAFEPADSGQDPLPMPFREAGFNPTARISGKTLQITFEQPSASDSGGAELFVHDIPAALRLGTPSRNDADGGMLSFEVPILSDKSVTAIGDLGLLLSVDGKSHMGRARIGEGR